MRARAVAIDAISLSLSGLPGATRMPCSRRANAITTASCSPGASATVATLVRLVITLQSVQVDGRDHHLAARQPPQSFFASFRQAREAAAALAQRPFQQRIMAAADDRRRSDIGERRRRDQAGRHPAVEGSARKQPTARHLGARHRALRHELIELALGQAQVGRGLVGGQEDRACAKYADNMQLLRKLTISAASAQDAQRDGLAMPSDVSALQLVLTGDPALLAIVRLSLIVSLSAVFLAALIGVPFGALIALTQFPGRQGVIVVLNALMGLPPVVVGLAVFLALSRSGPLGSWGLLFTPKAMVIAQTVLVAPIIAALTRQTIEDLWIEYRDELTAMNIGPAGRVATLIWDARFSLVTALLAGFGRAAAEVGAIIIVGGNIDGFTRTMTTAIALETSKGDLPLAIGLGMVLIAIVVAVNALAWTARRAGERLAG